MNIEQLCNVDGTVIRYKDIVKIAQFNKNIILGIEKQTRIKITDKKGTIYRDFIPSDTESFVNALKQWRPNAEYIVE